MSWKLALFYLQHISENPLETSFFFTHRRDKNFGIEHRVNVCLTEAYFLNTFRSLIESVFIMLLKYYQI